MLKIKQHHVIEHHNYMWNSCRADNRNNATRMKKIPHYLSSIFAQGRILFDQEICYLYAMSVNRDVSLSSNQWRASNCQGRPPVGVVWSSCGSMQRLQGECLGLHYSRQACCDVPIRAVLERRAVDGSYCLQDTERQWINVVNSYKSGCMQHAENC